MRSKNCHILLVEDDLNLGYLLLEFLNSHGFEVKLFRDGEGGYLAFQKNHFDFCILDIMLPSMDGITLATRIRETDAEVPVIFLTAKSLKEDKLKGFRVGIDDYITKPFDEEELLCRIEAILKRSSRSASKDFDYHFTLGSLSFDYKNQMLCSPNYSKRITTKESEVLKILCISKNNIVRREDLLVSVWGKNDYFTGRSLDVFVTKLRRYIGEDPSLRIESVPKIGFILSDQNKR